MTGFGHRLEVFAHLLSHGFDPAADKRPGKTALISEQFPVFPAHLVDPFGIPIRILNSRECASVPGWRFQPSYSADPNWRLRVDRQS